MNGKLQQRGSKTRLDKENAARAEVIEALSKLARALWHREKREPSATGLDSYGAREALERFVALAEAGAFTARDLGAYRDLVVVCRLIKTDVLRKYRRTSQKVIQARIEDRLMVEALENCGKAPHPPSNRPAEHAEQLRVAAEERARKLTEAERERIAAHGREPAEKTVEEEERLREDEAADLVSEALKGEGIPDTRSRTGKATDPRRTRKADNDPDERKRRRIIKHYQRTRDKGSHII